MINRILTINVFQAQLDKLNERKIKFVVASGNQMAHVRKYLLALRVI